MSSFVGTVQCWIARLEFTRIRLDTRLQVYGLRNCRCWMTEMMTATAGVNPARTDEMTLLIVDDDRPLRTRLSRAMEERGFKVRDAESVAAALVEIANAPPAFALVDMRLEDGNGMQVIEALTEVRSDARIVLLTGYGNIASAVTAIKAGAVDYLPKPADADQIAAALLEDESALPPPPTDPMSADRVRWEHIQRVYEQCGRNVSETARRLKMHRRTLQRILNKHAPRP